jgi:hypothetical protein
MEDTAAMLFNRNEKQLNFNSIKGVITESTDGENWCSIVLSVGHENVRMIHFAIKKPQYDAIKDKHPIGAKVNVIFYLTSRFKNERWYTTANVLQIDSVI